MIALFRQAANLPEQKRSAGENRWAQHLWNGLVNPNAPSAEPRCIGADPAFRLRLQPVMWGRHFG